MTAQPPVDPNLNSFLRLAGINILSNLMVPLAGLFDVAFLGHLDELWYLAGVALATVLFNYLYWTFGFLRMGTTGLTAQALGRQDTEAMLLVGLRNGVVALGLALGILLLQWPIRMVGFSVLSATPEVKAAGQSYFDALIWGAPATLLNFVVVGWYLGRAQSRKVLLLSGVNNVTNIGFNYLFIVQWGWQSAGAGAATALSQYLMLIVGLGLIRRDISGPQLQMLWPQIGQTAALRQTLTFNRDILVRTFALISTFAVFTHLSSDLGIEILSINTLLLQVVTLAAYFIDGIAFAMENVAGVLSQQQQSQRLRQLLILSGGMSISVGIGFALLFCLFPRPLLSLLTHHETVLTQVDQYVAWLLPVMGFGAIAYLLDGYFLGLAAGKHLRQSVLMATLMGFLPFAIAAWQWRQVHLLWLALVLSMGGRAIYLALQIPQSLRFVDGTHIIPSGQKE
ncbi:MATE family efflux transporter [Acaryochloris sp. IP29b_bin.137]|uniref:MATE family efflux transporter n=1 Tax=Acaryochloris sp. IP29b_bin.137 TaxID=2969217 RepID=UPI002601E7C5|nr:MATE family efflux transporter [Acaryochloris sp. IP29b_bin.137]